MFGNSLKLYDCLAKSLEPVNYEYYIFDVFDKNTSTSEIVDDNLVIKVEVPGIKKEDISVSVEDDMLVIKGKTDNRSIEKKYSINKKYDIKNISAKLDLGVLEVTIPTKEESKSYNIEIK